MSNHTPPPTANAMTGLVEIAALTALVGSVTAETLVLGSRGAAGLPWASLSAFGSLFLIKACIAAATPSWLRDTLGVRNLSSDAAVGLSLNLERKYKGTKNVADAVGVRVLSKVWMRHRFSTFYLVCHLKIYSRY